MEATTSVKNYVSKNIAGAAGVTIDHRVVEDAKGAKEIFSSIKREAAPLGYLNYGRDGNRCQIFFEPFTATTAREKKAIVATALADLDELLTPVGDGGE